MDISTLTPSERTVEIKHPVNGEPIGLTITLRPSSDPHVRAAARKFANERLQRGSKITAEKLEQQQLAVIAAAVSGWAWAEGATFKGQQPDFSEANLLQVIKALPWVKTQLDEELGDDAAFFQN
jgi:hypothetical protein